jgi:hypothetical protein
MMIQIENPMQPLVLAKPVCLPSPMPSTAKTAMLVIAPGTRSNFSCLSPLVSIQDASIDGASDFSQLHTFFDDGQSGLSYDNGCSLGPSVTKAYALSAIRTFFNRPDGFLALIFLGHGNQHGIFQIIVFFFIVA